MYLYTHRLISFFEALCLLINYHIRAVLFSNSVFSHFLVVMYSESLQGSYTSTGLLTPADTPGVHYAPGTEIPAELKGAARFATSSTPGNPR